MAVVVINSRVWIPLAELQFRFSTSSGPGGQHVNRSATRVTLLFDVAGSASLDEGVRGRLLQKLGNRLDSEGVLHVVVQESRSQWQNRETAVLRFRTILAHALHTPKKRHPTKPGTAAIERRLTHKKKQSVRKKERHWRYEA